MQECCVLMKILIFKNLFPVSFFSLVLMLPVTVLSGKVSHCRLF